MLAEKPYELLKYYGWALDPIHVGTGGYRLGQVDLTIVREPGSELPKIPGSSLEGTCRAYTAMSFDQTKHTYRREVYYDATDRSYNTESSPQRKKTYISCAGKGGADGSEHCGKIDCPVCVTYGFTIGPQNRSFQGLAQFSDARILFFPVFSMVGPVWITSPRTLQDAGLEFIGTLPGKEEITLVSGLLNKEEKRLNLGWISLPVKARDFILITSDSESLPKTEGAEESDETVIEVGAEAPDILGIPKEIQDHLVLVPDSLFSLIVNSNLEVRTSVAIDPATGAAADKALFTYEAIPRGTVFFFNVVFNKPEYFVFPELKLAENEANNMTPLSEKVTVLDIEKYVESGLRLMEFLGVGGMSTRGFGRFQVLNLEKIQEVPS